MGVLGDELVGAVDFAFRQAAVERQSQKLTVALLGRGEFRRDRPLAELRGGQRDQHVANDAEAAARRIGNAWEAACRRISSSLALAICCTSRTASPKSGTCADQTRSRPSFHSAIRLSMTLHRVESILRRCCGFRFCPSQL